MTTHKFSAAAALVLAPLAANAAPVPWINEPAVMPASPAMDASPAQPCSGADLQLVLGGAGAYHGQATQELLLRNRSDARCRLDAAPTVEFASRRGWQAVANTLPQETAVELPPRATLGVLIGTPGACEATIGPDRQVVQRLRVIAPDVAMEAAGAHVDVTCGAPTVLRIDRHGSRASPAAAGSLQALTAELTAPGSATAGSRLDYTVTLKNPTDQPVALSSGCPAYEQVLNTADGVSESSSLRLNCAGAANAVPAHGELQFEMRADVPQAAGHEGGIKLGWRLAHGPAAGAVIPLR